MRVQDLMTQDVVSCSPETNLAVAAELMWNADCGVLPVIADGKLRGILTDRDITIALGTRNRPASDIPVQEVAATGVEKCLPNVDVHAAMTQMRMARVHRLPVVNSEGEVQGILSINDIVLASDRKDGSLDSKEVLKTIKALCEHRSHPAQGQALPLQAAVA